VKFGFPAANALTVLAWGGITWKEGYEGAGELDNLLEAIKWGTDWLIKCHVSDNEFYAQVGNGVEDHKTWIRPEENDNQGMWRPSYKINCQNPGSDMAAEAASTFASASMLFKGKDNAYSAKLLDHAERIYAFAEKCKGKYSDSISDAAIFYNSWSGYGDELAWGAAWLHKATGDASYLTKAKQYYDQYSLGGKTDVFSWDNKAVGVQALLAELDGGSAYKNSLKTFCDKAVSGQTRSPGGELHYFQWGSLRYASNAAFICLQAADLVAGKKDTYTDLAEGQMDYILGDNPLGMSFVVGYGTKYPKNPHHSASACPDPPQSCGWGDFSSRATNTHLLVGALVGGPGAPDDQYVDKRDDYIEAEVTLDYNAGFQGVLAGLQMKKCNA
jgi:endoglucanase